MLNQTISTIYHLKAQSVITNIAYLVILTAHITATQATEKMCKVSASSQIYFQ